MHMCSSLDIYEPYGDLASVNLIRSWVQIKTS